MNTGVERFHKTYQDALREYLREPGEVQLNRAYEMGRNAMLAGVDILSTVYEHHAALQALITLEDPEARKRACTAAGRFLAECLSPYEMSHRGTREAALSLQRLNETLENEAKRIAQALHNEAGQLLASVHIALSDLARTLPGSGAKRVGAITEMLKDSEDALRDLSHDLRPMVLEHLGLMPALRFLAEKIARRNGLAIDVIGESHMRLPASVESAVYRAAQEALNNVVKHAYASNVRIRLRCGSRWLGCLVQDDGVGLSRSQHREDGSGLGLIGIRERLGTLGGSFRIASRGQRGTKLLLVVPLGA